MRLKNASGGRKRKLIYVALSFLFFSILAGVVAAQDSTDALDREIQKQYQEMLATIEERIKEHQEAINKLSKQSATLEKELAILKREIERAELQIQATTLRIQETNSSIKDKQYSIERLEAQVAEERAALAEMLRTIDAREQTTPLELLLSKDSLSDFFGEIHALEDMQAYIQSLLEEMRALKRNLEKEKSELEQEKKELEQLLKLAHIQKGALEEKRQAKEKLLRDARGEEMRYRRLVMEEKQNIEDIRRQMYQLDEFGIALPFEEALKFAQRAGDATGVRPALLLAVLQKESKWGQNLGKGNWRDDMHPSQHEAFLEITKKLGLNPDLTPVSAKPDYGWGGAMGPAQFLPKTWLAYEKDISRITGHNTPSPWNIEDAFSAAALKLEKGGAYLRTPQGEWQAVMVYFAGGNWDNPAFRFYGDSVMDLADFFQEQIHLITQ